MTRFFDGKNILEITIQERTGSGYTPDWSADFLRPANSPLIIPLMLTFSTKVPLLST